MFARNGTDKTHYKPIYSQTEPNQAIKLGQVVIQFEHEGKSYHKTANATMTFLPKCDFTFVIPLDGDNSSIGQVSVGTKLKLTLPQRGVAEDFFCSAAGEKYGGLVFSPTRSCISVMQSSSIISSAIFHLFNFPNFWAPDDQCKAATKRATQSERKCKQAILKADGWIITISALDGINDLEKELDSQGGYLITHVGTISREDGTTFTSEQLDDLLTCLHHFLSFTLGCWAGLALPIGFDKDKNRVFEQWGVRRVANGAWNPRGSWFDRHHGELFSQVFPGFLSLWQNTIWRQPLASAIYWYVEACDSTIGVGADTGIILAQTALELMAWTYCVTDREMVLPDTFKKPGALKASDKLRMLTSNLGIPREIPSELPALRDHTDPKWGDGYHATTDIRNSIVHPDKKGTTANLYYPAYQLSLWYIDLVLLRLCGHNGYYANRLQDPNNWVGDVEPVPWIKSDPSIG